MRILTSFLAVLLIASSVLCPMAAAEEAAAPDWSKNFVLLYNTLGYERLGTKKALVRSIAFVEPETIPGEWTWMLLDASGQIVAEGMMDYRAYSLGLQLWELRFDEVTAAGTYQLKIFLTAPDGSILYQELSTPFQIADSLYTANMLLPLTLYNARARVAPEKMGGGFYDCHSQMGEAYSHGIFLNALVQTLLMTGDQLTEEDKLGLQDAASTAFDYLTLLHKSETGEFANSHPSRPYPDTNPGLHNTYEALYGYCAYLWYFRDLEPSRASAEAYERAVLSFAYVEEQYPSGGFYASVHPHMECLIPCCYYLYLYSGDKQWLDKGVSLINSQLANFNIAEQNRSGSHAIPYFEGVYLFAQLLKDDPVRTEWIARLTEIQDAYFTNLPERNAFGIIPISDYGPTEWEDMTLAPATHQFHPGRAANAMDMCFIGELTNAPWLEENAAGELGWLMGLNAGFNSNLVSEPKGYKPDENNTSPMKAGAFVYNLNIRRAKTWTKWSFTRRDMNMVSLMNGFKPDYGKTYYYANMSSNDYWYSETFIKTDGVYAYAFQVYERFISLLCAE